MRKYTLTAVLTILLTSLYGTAFVVQNVQSNEMFDEKTLVSPVLPSDMPVVYVDPPNVVADLGETFTISVKIFNLSHNFHMTDEQWEYGETLGPPGVRHNYSLGGLFGADIRLKWDPTVLGYVEHTVTMPVETYPEGLLHAEPELIDVKDEVDSEAGTYLLSKSSQYPADAFNLPDENATAFSMMFTVLKRGTSEIAITRADLAIPIAYQEYIWANADIPHWRINGFLQTPVLATRIKSLTVNPLDNGTLFTLPVISNESAFITSTIINDGNITDTYNLTLHWGPTLLYSYFNETIEPMEQKTYNHTINSIDLALGNHSVTADLTSVQLSAQNLTDHAVQNFVVVDVPYLAINGPTSGMTGDTLSFNAFNSTHSDPYGKILNYSWTLTYLPETLPRFVQYGETATFIIDERWPGGSWIVALEVRDNYGVEFDRNRPASAPYRIEHLLTLIAVPSPIRITFISSSAGSPGSIIYLDGDRASPDGLVELYFNEDYITATRAYYQGEWSMIFYVPVVSPGHYTIEVVDVTSGSTDTIGFNVLEGPILHVTPTETTIGSKITIFGENFQQMMGLYLSFEDLMFFSLIGVSEDGTFNATLIVPVVNSGDYVIKAIGMPYMYPGTPVYAEVTIHVTVGLDTLFSEIDDLKDALNELMGECGCNYYNYSNYNYNYNYNYNCDCNCSNSDPVVPSSNEPPVEGETEVTQSSAPLSETDDVPADDRAHILDSVEKMIFEVRTVALISVLVAAATCILTAVILSRRR
jgi:hypothetical protein